MPAPLRRALLCACVALLGALAHLPLAQAGFQGGDLALLAEVGAAAERGWAQFPGWFEHGAIRPLHAAALFLLARTAGASHPAEPAAAQATFLLAFAALLVAAAGAAITLRRVLLPWLGESAARAAGWACAGIAVAHPISVAAVARPAALGDLLALAAGAWCAALYLRARQQRDSALLSISVVLAIVAGFGSPAAWLVPPLVAALERTSARRQRPHGARRGAAVLALLVATACVAIEPLIAARTSAGRGLFAWTQADWGARALSAVEALAGVVLCVPSRGTAWVYLIAGLVVLLALAPLQRAARAAPRLWGWLLLGWIAALLLALALAPAERGAAGRAELADALWPASLIASAGLAAACTALGGARRTLLPLFVAIGLCALANAAAREFPRATGKLLALRADLERALDLAGGDGRDGGDSIVLAADVPAAEGGLGAESRLGPPERLDLLALPWALAKYVDAVERVRRVERNALTYLLQLPDGRAARARGLAVSLLRPERGARIALRIEPAHGAPKALLWRGEGRSELLDVDPLQLGAARVAPRSGASTGAPPRMGWLPRSSESRSLQGAWVETDDGPRALFDLAGSLEWTLSGRVERVWFENQLHQVDSAELLPVLPLALGPPSNGPLSTGPRSTGPLSTGSAPRPLNGELSWKLVRVWPATGRARTYEGRPIEQQRVVFPAADADPLPGGFEFVECSIDGVVVGRSEARPR